MTDELEGLNRLTGVTWKWNHDAPAEAQRRPGIGGDRPNVEAVFPELVSTGEDGIKRVDYIGLIGPMIDAIKTLDACVRLLEAAAQRNS